jgi:hypothetical protein
MIEINFEWLVRATMAETSSLVQVIESYPKIKKSEVVIATDGKPVDLSVKLTGTKGCLRGIIDELKVIKDNPKSRRLLNLVMRKRELVSRKRDEFDSITCQLLKNRQVG